MQAGNNESDQDRSALEDKDTEHELKERSPEEEYVGQIQIKHVRMPPCIHEIVA
jgi:hypothetical protein